MFQYKSHFFPGFIILMTGATQDHYLPCLKYCHSLVPYFSLTVAIGDMETASRNIITLTFGYLPLFLVRFCVFHYAQCNLRNIGFKGLLKQFKRKSRGGFKNLFYLWARLVMCLPFMPADYIIPTWVELKTVSIEYFDLSENANLEKYKSYACDSPRGAINHGVLHGATLHLGFCEDCIQLYTVGLLDLNLGRNCSKKLA